MLQCPRRCQMSLAAHGRALFLPHSPTPPFKHFASAERRTTATADPRRSRRLQQAGGRAGASQQEETRWQRGLNGWFVLFNLFPVCERLPLGYPHSGWTSRPPPTLQMGTCSSVTRWHVSTKPTSPIDHSLLLRFGTAIHVSNAFPRKPNRWAGEWRGWRLVDFHHWPHAMCWKCIVCRTAPWIVVLVVVEVRDTTSDEIRVGMSYVGNDVRASRSSTRSLTSLASDDDRAAPATNQPTWWYYLASRDSAHLRKHPMQAHTHEHVRDRTDWWVDEHYLSVSDVETGSRYHLCQWTRTGDFADQRLPQLLSRMSILSLWGFVVVLIVVYD